MHQAGRGRRRLAGGGRRPLARPRMLRLACRPPRRSAPADPPCIALLIAPRPLRAVKTVGSNITFSKCTFYTNRVRGCPGAVINATADTLAPLAGTPARHPWASHSRAQSGPDELPALPRRASPLQPSRPACCATLRPCSPRSHPACCAALLPCRPRRAAPLAWAPSPTLPCSSPISGKAGHKAALVGKAAPAWGRRPFPGCVLQSLRLHHLRRLLCHLLRHLQPHLLLAPWLGPALSLS